MNPYRCNSLWLTKENDIKGHALWGYNAYTKLKDLNETFQINEYFWE